MLVYDDPLYDANGANWFAVTITLVSMQAMASWKLHY
jgi:hypothetical protein